LDKVPDESVRDDCQELIKIMKKITGEPPKMWGPSIVGFGKYHYKYDSAMKEIPASRVFRRESKIYPCM
jgi:hypothetical protein